MKSNNFLFACFAMASASGIAMAQSEGSPNLIEISSYLSLEYDDNVYEQETGEQDSFKVIEDLDFMMTFDNEPTFLTLNYSPAFVWWSDRDPDDTDIHHSLDLIFGHEFTPRVTLGLKNNFRIAEQPEEIARGVTVRENNDYTYNQTSGNLGIMVAPKTQVEIGGRYSLLYYDEDAVAVDQDRDIVAAGITLRHRLNAKSSLSADYRKEIVAYDNQDTADLRDLETDFIGLGYEQIEGALIGILRAGYHMQSYEDENVDEQDQPYFDVTIAYAFTPRTRLTLGAAYSMIESDVASYASQDRTILNASLTHQPSGKIRVILTGSYRMAEYNEETRVDNNAAIDGEETALQLGLRLNYALNARNSLEFVYSMLDVESDIREDFDRNRISLGWRLDI